jgi:hypothetical protein
MWPRRSSNLVLSGGTLAVEIHRNYQGYAQGDHWISRTVSAVAQPANGLADPSTTRSKTWVERCRVPYIELLLKIGAKAAEQVDISHFGDGALSCTVEG